MTAALLLATNSCGDTAPKCPHGASFDIAAIGLVALVAVAAVITFYSWWRGRERARTGLEDRPERRQPRWLATLAGVVTGWGKRRSGG